MESLRDLKNLVVETQKRFSQYEGSDFILPEEFKEAVNEINSGTVSYYKYSAVVESSGDLHIWLPNQWFYIASYFTEYYNELLIYKNYALKVATKDRLKVLNNSSLSEREEANLQALPLDDISKNFLKLFITDYSWWGGAKTIDRGDFYVSPILSYAKLVNASQSYIADLCAFLANKQDLVKLIIEAEYQQSQTLLQMKHLASDDPLQQIFYGAPGTGKSRRIKEFLKRRNVPKTNIFRTTFHPDSDYSSFVGSYKPSKGTKMMYGLNGGSTIQMRFDGKVLEEEVITYRYIPQVFLLAYIQAFKNPDENVYLVIEEINRGNCAQIFGDLFQLLDRDEYGKSEYPIKADTDLKKFLEDELGKDNEGIADGELCLPSNFRIYATMNTSDQSLFPIDSAFKRRWDWEYEPIKYKNTTWMIDIDGVKYSWVKFQKEVNNRILKDTGSEDKMMGDYFVNPNTGVISKNLFLNKILFYLWNDVCKDGDTDIFPTNNDFSFSSLYADDSSQTLHSLMENLNVQPEPDSPSEGDEEDNLPDSNNGNSNKIPRYSIDGSTELYSTPNAVHKVIEDYALQNEATSVDDMIKLWNEISGRSNYAVAEWEPSPNDNQPFAGKRRSEIKWGNGKSIWIINGWTKDLFKIFISNVKDRFGIDIEEVE